ncbi:hypothetical protein FM101_04190 [Arthrobacter rhombi]|uniref:Uncharacterized protein n=1 Tax=Arthrobacter rhombi TaxID=71253 RepID=A0A1R4FJ45_9MICC|nr:hypothetical protein FM101_04190 [Arthrobacter rhombi]
MVLSGQSCEFMNQLKRPRRTGGVLRYLNAAPTPSLQLIRGSPAVFAAGRL